MIVHIYEMFESHKNLSEEPKLLYLDAEFEQ